MVDPSTYIAKMATNESSIQIAIPDEFVDAGLNKFNNFLKVFYLNTRVEIFKVPEKIIEAK
jgi:hypothetical protein